MLNCGAHMWYAIGRYGIVLGAVLSSMIAVPDRAAAQGAGRAVVPLTAAEEAALKPKDGFKECDVCPEMVVVPAGSFTMGLTSGEAGAFRWELPQRQVTIARPFAVGKFEATFAEWDACVADGGCMLNPNDQGWGRGKQPVINVSWDDIIKQYLPWLSRKTGKAYRLPTEAEWEYVARAGAGTSTRFWWGASVSTDQANYEGSFTYGGSPKGESRKRTVPVDSFSPNPWGLYNVHGNVWEWVQDCWNQSYRGAPSDGSPWTTGDCRSRPIRGGSWVYGPLVLCSGCRNWIPSSARSYNIGFRVARTI